MAMVIILAPLLIALVMSSRDLVEPLLSGHHYCKPKVAVQDTVFSKKFFFRDLTVVTGQGIRSVNFYTTNMFLYSK